MESDSRCRSVKVVRVLCDGCERASAVAYCTACNESACTTCAEQLHVRGRRTSKRSSARTCNGRSMKDLQKAVGVLALCTECRSRPASVRTAIFSLFFFLFWQNLLEGRRRGATCVAIENSLITITDNVSVRLFCATLCIDANALNVY